MTAAKLIKKMTKEKRGPNESDLKKIAKAYGVDHSSPDGLKLLIAKASADTADAIATVGGDTLNAEELIKTLTTVAKDSRDFNSFVEGAIAAVPIPDELKMAAAVFLEDDDD